MGYGKDWQNGIRGGLPPSPMDPRATFDYQQGQAFRERFSRYRPAPFRVPGVLIRRPEPEPQPQLSLGEFVGGVVVATLLVALLAGLVAYFLHDHYVTVGKNAAVIAFVVLFASALLSGVEVAWGLLVLAVGAWALLHWGGYVPLYPWRYW